jgi:hypothetical protein
MPTYYNPCLINVTDEFTKEQMELGIGSIGCANVAECLPRFDQAPAETVIQGAHNSFVVLGRDRNESWLSGRGGAGLTNCGMIDLVVGRGQLLAADNISKNKPPYENLPEIGPSFSMDAARVYITQGCDDIDEYFGLNSSDNGAHGFGCSAIGVKADQVRIIGREKVAIYAGPGTWEGFDKTKGETNCMGDTINNVAIELIAGKNAASRLEPMVLGDKLATYLKKEHELIRNILKQVFQIHVNVAMVSGPLSVVPGMAAVTVPIIKESGTGIYDSIAESFNTYLTEMGALDSDLGITGEEHILSKTCFLSK